MPDVIPPWGSSARASALVGVAFAGEGPGTWAIDTGVGTVALGDLTLPVALAMFGGQLSRAIQALAAWTPRLVVEHRHVQIDEPAGPATD